MTPVLSRVAALLSGAALLGATPTLAQEAKPAAAAAAPVATTDADPALWVVKDADTTIYLFGTVHVLKPGLSWFDEAVKDAFDKSGELVTEIKMPDDQSAMVQRMLPKALDTTGTALSSRLDPATLKAYSAALADLGMPATAFDPFEPWMGAMTLSVMPLAKAGYDPTKGVESVLTAAAKAGGKAQSELETLDQQIDYFDTMPMTDQVQYLTSVVGQYPKMVGMIDDMVLAWGKGDVDRLAAELNAAMAKDPKVADVLLYQRNARWADWIKTRMDQPGTVFVAVGAGHLAGEKSVQDYLAQKGLTVARVAY